ncbi:MAG: MoaD/ThiS family protein [Planctomycetota bacterium]
MCRATVRIPAALRKYTGGNGEIVVDGRTVAEALASLYGTYDAVIDRMQDRDGNLRHDLVLKLGGQNIRSLNGLESELTAGDVVSIVSMEQARNAG